MVKWIIHFHPEFDPEEYQALPEAVQNELLAHLNVLAEFGPQLGRPLVDTLKGSDHANMKELRFNVGDGVWRFAFAFDPKRQAIVLCGGNKGGADEQKFYKGLIRTADKRFNSHLVQLQKRDNDGKAKNKKDRKGKKR